MYDAPRSVRDLHDEYAEQVNLAVAEGRDDIIDALNAQFAVARAQLPATGHKSPPELPW
jgi:hypothetical protein